VCVEMVVLCMRNASGHNYRNSSFILDVAMGTYHVPQNTCLVSFYFLLLYDWLLICYINTDFVAKDR